MKKEITIAASSAVALIIVLGSASYLLFPKVPAQSTQGPGISILAYTQGGSLPGGNFNITHRDNVTIFAQVKNGTAPLAGRFVTYGIHMPGGILYDVGSTESLTNATGITQIETIPTWALWASWVQYGNQSRGDPVGKWQVTVTVGGSVNQTAADTLNFFVQQK